MESVSRILSFQLRAGLASGLSILLLTTAGCGRGESSREPTIPIAHEASASVADPLTRQDVARFLELVSRLPGGRVPEFEPLSTAIVSDSLPAQALADACRREYRAMFDTVQQGRLWRRDRRLQEVLEQHDLDPEQFAALVTRLSCALSAETVGGKLDLPALVSHCDEQLASTITELTALDALLANGRVSDLSGARHRREQLAEIIRQTVALAEFSGLLQSVPPESVAAVREFRGQLNEFLPRSTGDELLDQVFERRTDTQIVPTSFEKRP